MDLDALLKQIGDADIRFPLPTGRIPDTRAPEDVDALFHLPLLALAIMTAARHRPFRTVALGQTVARLLVERFTALRDTPRTLERSVTMRRRSVDALVFLEATGLVSVSLDDDREITLTEDGKTRLDRARRTMGDMGLLLRQLRTAQDRATTRWTLS
jgi:hypothetical protein